MLLFSSIIGVVVLGTILWLIYHNAVQKTGSENKLRKRSSSFLTALVPKRETRNVLADSMDDFDMGDSTEIPAAITKPTDMDVSFVDEESDSDSDELIVVPPPTGGLLFGNNEFSDTSTTDDESDEMPSKTGTHTNPFGVSFLSDNSLSPLPAVVNPELRESRAYFEDEDLDIVEIPPKKKVLQNMYMENGIPISPINKPEKEGDDSGYIDVETEPNLKILPNKYTSGADAFFASDAPPEISPGYFEGNDEIGFSTEINFRSREIPLPELRENGNSLLLPNQYVENAPPVRNEISPGYGNSDPLQDDSFSQNGYYEDRKQKENERTVAIKKLGKKGINFYKYAYGEKGNRIANKLPITRETQIGNAIPQNIINHKGFPIDWNSRFQNYLELPEDTEDQKLTKYTNLSSLNKDFLSVAINFGKIIISEAFIEKQYRTIKPALVGGQAGGAKYVYHGILFKFACDWMGIYGGDEYAMKAGAHEMKAFMRYHGQEGICVPLMALIDYRGYRLVAESILPINEMTIIYGSGNSGAEVFDDKGGIFAERMKAAAKKINIKGHYCGLSDREGGRKFLYGPTDIEGHKGSDGRYYLIDCARVMPPTSDKKVWKTFLYNLFRPEFVKTFKNPLSSDSFSPFGGSSETNEEQKINNQEVVEATQDLYENKIPNFAKWLDENFDSQTEGQLTEIVHREGINIRYLGLIRKNCKKAGVSNMLLLEMIARVLKNRLRELLRETMIKIKTLEEDCYNKVTIDFLNLILGFPVESSKNLWGIDVKFGLGRQFRSALRKIEKTDLFDLKTKINMSVLIQRIQVLTKVKLTKDSQRELKDSPGDFKVTVSDIKKIGVKVKHMNILSSAEANALVIKAFKTSTTKRGCDRLFSLAMAKFDEAIKSTPDNIDTLNNYANVLVRMGDVKGGDGFKFFEIAFQNYQLAKNWDKLLELAKHVQEKTFKNWVQQGDFYALAARSFQEIIEHSGNYDLVHTCYVDWGKLLLKQARKHQDDQYYMDSGEQFRNAIKIKPKGIFEILKDMEPLLTNYEIAILIEVSEKSFNFKQFDCCWTYKRQLITSSLLEKLLSLFSPEVLSLNGCLITDSFFQKNSKFLSELVKLKLTDCKKISDLAVKSLVNCKYLQRLDLSNCNITDSSIIILVQNTTKLSHLDLSKTKLTSKGLNEIGLNLKELIHLNISQTKVTDLGRITDCTLLQYINLSECKITDSDLTKLAKECPNLQHLNLEGCKTINSRGISEIGFRCKKLLSLDISNCNIQDSNYLKDLSNPSLQYLHLNNLKNITSEDFKILLKSLTNLKSLELGFCDIDDYDLGDISDNCRNLKHLSIAHTKITDTGFCWITEGCLELQYLDISSCNITDDSLNKAAENLIHLSVIKLSNCFKISDFGIINLAKTSTKLTYFDISGCREVTDSSIQMISNHCTLLNTLYLNRCNFLTDSSISSISSKLHALTILEVSQCLLISNVEGLLNGTPKLQNLNLHGCENISDYSIQKVARLPFLKTLNLNGCRRITSVSLLHLQSCAPSLKELVLGMNKISSTDIENLKQGRPKVNVRSSKGSTIQSAPRPNKISATVQKTARNSLLADLKKLKNHPLSGVSAEPLENNFFIWHCNLLGPEGSPYAGGVFHVELRFPQNYPAVSPSATMLSKLPHPHVQKDKICLSILSDYNSYFNENNGGIQSQTGRWSSAYDVQTILLQMLTFLMHLDEDQVDERGIEEYLAQIPSAIISNKKFACVLCPHKPGNIWPPFCDEDAAKLAQTNVLRQSASDIIEDQLVCFHSRVSVGEDLLGIGIIVERNKNTGKISMISSPLDLLSLSAFQQGVRQSVMNEKFTHWLPIYINEDHAKRCGDYFERCITDIFRVEDPNHVFTLDLAVDLLTKLMNTMIVNVMKGKVHASQKCLEGYCRFHRLLIMFALENPQLIQNNDEKIKKFINFKSYRTKQVIPALGEFLPLLTISSVTWSQVRQAYLEESFDRNVLWITKAHPELNKFEADPEIDETRSDLTFQTIGVSLKLLLFHVYFLEHIGKPEGKSLKEIAESYDELHGQPTQEMKNKWQSAIKDIQHINSWDEYFKRTGYTNESNNVPSKAELTIWLRRSVFNSVEKKYHKMVETCKYFAAHQTCRWGNKCRHSHDVEPALLNNRGSFDDLRVNSSWRVNGTSPGNIRGNLNRPNFQQKKFNSAPYPRDLTSNFHVNNNPNQNNINSYQNNQNNQNQNNQNQNNNPLPRNPWISPNVIQNNHISRNESNSQLNSQNSLDNDSNNNTIPNNLVKGPEKNLENLEN